MTTLKLYSRPECHLCEQMAEELAPLLKDGVTLEFVDISGDPGLEREFGISIPVLKAGDRELSRYRLDKRKVERYFAELT